MFYLCEKFAKIFTERIVGTRRFSKKKEKKDKWKEILLSLHYYFIIIIK